MIHSPSLDLERIRKVAEQEEHNEQYGVSSGHALRASRALAGRILGRFGKMRDPGDKFGVFTTGILLRSDFADGYLGNGVWLLNGIEISTVIHEGGEKYFKRSQLGKIEEDSTLYVEAFQIASPAASVPRDDGWRSREMRVGKRTLNYLERPERDAFNAENCDDHLWLLARYREGYAQSNHLIPHDRLPNELVDTMEARAIQENYETLAGMIGEITMPLAAVARHADLRNAWQQQ
ncbi:MAG: hypothetical protein ABWX94_00600 [Candidatus Saccharimonadales bacterium]